MTKLPLKCLNGSTKSRPALLNIIKCRFFASKMKEPFISLTWPCSKQTWSQVAQVFLKQYCTKIDRNSRPSYHYTKRQDFLWELKDYINLSACLYSFQKETRIFSEFFWRLSNTSFPPCFPPCFPAGAGNRHTPSPCHSLPLLMLSLLLPQRGLIRSGNIYVGNTVHSACNTACLYYPTL